MNCTLQRLLAGCAISIGLATPVWAQTSGAATRSPADDGYQLTATQQQAIEAYVQGRYRRVKATVVRDRAEARRHMSAEAWQRYVDKFHPETAIVEFGHCDACEEFGIRITYMTSWCAIFQLDVSFHDDTQTLNCSTTVEMETQPINPRGARVRRMASSLDWRPRGADLTYGDANEAARQAVGALEITEDRPLVRRRMPLGACLQQAASGGLCH